MRESKFHTDLGVDLSRFLFRSTARQHQSSANLDWQVPPTQFRRTTSGSHSGTWTGRATE